MTSNPHWAAQGRRQQKLVARYVRGLAYNHALRGGLAGAVIGGGANAGLAAVHNAGISPYKKNVGHAAIRGGLVGGTLGATAGFIHGHGRALERVRRSDGRLSDYHRRNPPGRAKIKAQDKAHAARQAHAATVTADAVEEAKHHYWQTLRVPHDSVKESLRMHAAKAKHSHGPSKKIHEAELRFLARQYGFDAEEAIKHASAKLVATHVGIWALGGALIGGHDRYDRSRAKGGETPERFRYRRLRQTASGAAKGLAVGAAAGGVTGLAHQAYRDGDQAFWRDYARRAYYKHTRGRG